MANLSLTAQCNRACEYCFAPADLPPGTMMSAGVFERLLDLLERSGVAEARLLGGEPTLHPEFIALVERALARGFRVRLFSNGLMSEGTRAALADLPPESVAVLINAGDGQPERRREQERTLERLGPRALLGFNIHAPVFEPGFMLDWIERFGLSRSVRFGLAHPIAGGTNRFLHPRLYRAAAARLAEFARQAEERGVEVGLDCGFVPCIFPAGSIAALGKTGKEIGRSCGAIPDILPDGRAVPCYPLVHLASRRRAEDAIDLRSLREDLETEVGPLRSIGVFQACDPCELRRSGDCRGGCVAAGILRLRTVTPAGYSSPVFPPAVPGRPHSVGGCGPDPQHVPQRSRWVIPYIDQPLEFWQQLKSDFGERIAEVYVPLPPGVLGSGRPPQPRRHVEDFLRSAPFDRGVLVNPITLPRPVDEVAPVVIEALRRLAGEYGIVSATVSSLLLARRLREALPRFRLAASVLADIARPNQALMAMQVCDTIVAASRIVRDLPALQALRAAFPGRLRLIVNEACLPGCPYRVEHFHEMGSGITLPQSLCFGLLAREPWLRLTGAWILPQHLHLYDGLWDELKLAGRVTLRNPSDYRRVLGAYIRKEPLAPDEIGGGPASVLERIEITEEFFAATLRCGQRCHECSLCRDYWRQAAKSLTANQGRALY